MDDFFAWIRSCYNHRTENPEYNRLAFALFGVATPSELVHDHQRAPFNVGQAIELQGFQLQEIQPLVQGLEGVVENPLTLLKEILKWTGGQPFLTQKLCQLVLEQRQTSRFRKSDFSTVNLPSNSNPFLNQLVREALAQHNDPAIWVRELVHSQVINDWESHDNPEHLRTIYYRLLARQQRHPQQSIDLLLHYRQLLQTHSLKANGSIEQAELLLSGLVIKQGNALHIRNPIYQAVFNLQWVDATLAKLQTTFRELTNSHPVDTGHYTPGESIDRLELDPCHLALIRYLDRLSPNQIEAVAQEIVTHAPAMATAIVRVLKSTKKLKS
ncbi:MAG TPA: AAA-like domain-containing protein [Coleofasciculaceae cyanobacterium]